MEGAFAATEKESEKVEILLGGTFEKGGSIYWVIILVKVAILSADILKGQLPPIEGNVRGSQWPGAALKPCESSGARAPWPL